MEVIKIIDNKLSLLLTENDIQEVKNYFNSIKMVIALLRNDAILLLQIKAK